MSQKKKIYIFENSYTLTNALIKEWFNIVDEAIEKRGRFTVALSGGQTPVEFYSRLSGMDQFEKWQKTIVFQTDERYIPESDPANNFSMLHKTLLSYVTPAKKNIYPMKTDVDLKDVVKNYILDLQTCFKDDMINGIPVFDLMFLGMGVDGHIASLFPHDLDYKNSSQLVHSVSQAELEHQRISLTLPVINQARKIIVLVTGQRKSEMLVQLLKHQADVPAQQLKSEQSELIYFIDKEAAEKLDYLQEYEQNEDALIITL